MKYLQAKDECNDLKLQNMSQKLVEGSLAILMLLLVKCGLCVCVRVCTCAKRERETFVTVSICFEGNGLEAPSLTFIFFCF